MSKFFKYCPQKGSEIMFSFDSVKIIDSTLLGGLFLVNIYLEPDFRSDKRLASLSIQFYTKEGALSCIQALEMENTELFSEATKPENIFFYD